MGQQLNEQSIFSGHTKGLPGIVGKDGEWFVKKPNGTYDVIPDWLWNGSVGPSLIQTILNTPVEIPGGPGEVTDYDIVGGSDDFDINDYGGWYGMPTDDNPSGWNPNP